MSLKLGVWKMNLNGIESLLALSSVDQNGSVLGDFNNRHLKGLWDYAARILTFSMAAQNPRPPDTSAVLPMFFTGYLFSTPSNPAPGQDVQWTLTGFAETTDFSAAAASGGNARRSIFGWFAQIIEVS